MLMHVGVGQARLPITEHVSLQCGTMLAVNHVFKILLEFEQRRAAGADDGESGVGGTVTDEA